ncbi:MAG: biotin--[acetyl-CoA-carboxylase] ligase [Candidatus Omnitrophica bacterium]|nr:biotin--[acetyl-CoA-carboxylase] ligase [Candidatus Omnitrophota bacterium]
MQEKILDFLKKKQEYVSGDYMSQRLDISRQALWKHIQELKDAGYDIVAVPHLGYRLISSPDRLYPAEIQAHLRTKFLGKKIHYFDCVSSTMNMAMELGMNGAPEGAIVVAESQTKGRGRLGRSWLSPKYKGIYVSIILRPKISPLAAPLLTLLAGVSVCEAIKDLTGIDAQIKWPNDIFIHNKKVGGILTELNAEMDVTRFVNIGIGLNVNHDKKIEGLHATSLKDQKKEDVSRVGLLQELLHKIEANYLLFQSQGSAQVIDKWRHYSLTLGKRVRIAYQKTHLEGEAMDIDTDGGLLIRTDFGTVQKVMAGDVLH